MPRFFFLLLSSTVYLGAVSDKEIQSLQKYCTQHPDTWEGHYNLGRAFYLNSDFDNAEKHFVSALEKCPQPNKQESILYNLGNTNFREAQALKNSQNKIPRLGKSIQSYEGALALNKNADDTRHNLKVAKDLLNKLKQQQRKKQNNGKNDQDKKQNNEENKTKDNEQQNVSSSTQQQEMQNVLEKEQSHERILPESFSSATNDLNNGGIPQVKVLKDW